MNKSLKRAIAPALALAVMVPAMAYAAAMNGDSGMTAKVDYSRVTVMKKDGHELVPLRQIAMSLGYSVDWTKQAVMLTRTGMMGMGMQHSDMKDMNDMTDTSDMSEMTDMPGMKPQPYTVTLMPGSTRVTAGMAAKTADYAPVVIMGKTYVTKPLVETFLAMTP
ncbi:Copper amine oxidase N-terminal domain-containing protein [Paenibacillus sp. UNC496MF]|uniref:stalk domain-containing protein n=1 Tax=Paenibacillus sp. UNC496MF TaxID=1502753 RepID=UPI0008EFF08A|nr:stalk domain-containing protein [Paenibacillus sp. UNC496MF]SFJ51759.1 Copper amine oxidase N-terminal domain-containing protein [Paenibacillus sp. UNC496MF]